MTLTINKLISFASVALGGMTGYFVGLPLDVSGMFPFPATPLFILGGLLVGWRRRHNTNFVYFAAICVLILSILISSSMMPH